MLILMWDSDSLQYTKINIKLNLPLHLNNQALCPEDVWGSGSIPPTLLSSALIIMN
jgi:hypothetical protein